MTVCFFTVVIISVFAKTYIKYTQTCVKATSTDDLKMKVSVTKDADVCIWNGLGLGSWPCGAPGLWGGLTVERLQLFFFFFPPLFGVEITLQQ